MRIIWQTVRRITNKILRFKGLKSPMHWMASGSVVFSTVMWWSPDHGQPCCDNIHSANCFQHCRIHHHPHRYPHHHFHCLPQNILLLLLLLLLLLQLLLLWTVPQLHLLRQTHHRRPEPVISHLPLPAEIPYHPLLHTPGSHWNSFHFFHRSKTRHHHHLKYHDIN